VHAVPQLVQAKPDGPFQAANKATLVNSDCNGQTLQLPET
jgi:hypothetical protein